MPINEAGQQDGQQQDQQGQQQDQQTQQSSTQTQNGDQQGQQNQQQQGQRGSQQQSRMIPYDRFQQVNTGYQTEKQRADQLAAQLDQATRQIQALAGVRNVDPSELEADEVRKALFKLVPGLEKLSDDKIERLLQLAANGDQIEETNKTIWKNHGQKMIRTAQDSIADQLRVEKLTERQSKRISREYVNYIEENSYMDEYNRPAGAILRHEAGDESLIEEFAKEFLADWQESIRKSVVTQETRPMRPVPSGRGRSIVMGRAKQKIDHSDPKAFGDAAVASFLEHGGSFGEK